MMLSNRSKECGYCTSASSAMRSPSVTMPASLPSSTTGAPPILFSRNRAARSLTDRAGSTVMTGVVMMSQARASPSTGRSVVLMRFLLWAGLEPLHGCRQELEQVAGHHTLGADGVLRRQVGGEAVQVGAQAGGVGGAETLGQLGDDHAAQHVARTRGGQAGVAGRDGPT